jgi:hypothetical protein
LKKIVSAFLCPNNFFSNFWQACKFFFLALSALFSSPLASAGLPDGLFSNQKSQFGSIWEGLGMENFGIFYDHMDYFTAICYH